MTGQWQPVQASVKNHWKALKPVPLISALGLFLAGCHRHDAELVQQIPGVWKQELKTYTNTLTISPGGTFAYARLTTNSQTTFTNAGTWRIRGGSIILIATNAFGEHPLPLGELFKTKIIALNDNQWSFEMGDGRTGDFKR